MNCGQKSKRIHYHSESHANIILQPKPYPWHWMAWRSFLFRIFLEGYNGMLIRWPQVVAMGNALVLPLITSTVILRSGKQRGKIMVFTVTFFVSIDWNLITENWPRRIERFFRQSIANMTFADDNILHDATIFENRRAYEYVSKSTPRY